MKSIKKFFLFKFLLIISIFLLSCNDLYKECVEDCEIKKDLYKISNCEDDCLIYKKNNCFYLDGEEICIK